MLANSLLHGFVNSFGASFPDFGVREAKGDALNF